MSDTSFPVYMHYGTNAERLAFTPDPPASGQPIYVWYETDTGSTYLYDTTWHLLSGPGGGNINVSAGTTSNNLTNFVLSNSNGISFGLNGSTITAAHNGLTSQSSQIVSADNGSYAFQTLSFSNANGVSFITSAGSAIAASIAAPGAANINISAGTTSNDLTAFVLSNSNNVSFGLNGSTVTATVTVATSLTNVNISAGTTSNNLSALVFSNSNNVTFGLDGSTITASASADGGTAAVGTLSYWQNILLIPSLQTKSLDAQMIINPFILDQNISADVVGLLWTNSIAQRTHGTTGANSTFTARFLQTLGFNIFTKMTGASSLSFSNLTVLTAGSTFETSYSCGAIGSQYSVSQRATFVDISGVTSSTSVSYASTSGSFVVLSSGFGVFTGNRLVGVPFSGSLSPGSYWAGIGLSTTFSSGGVGLLNPITPRLFAVPNVASAIFGIGLAAATNPEFAAGVFSSGGQNFSTSNFHLTQLTANSLGHQTPFFNFLRIV